jgi:probable rRNA maturation factor
MILNRQRRVRISLSSLETFLRQVQGELRLRGREVSVCMVSDRDIARMNRQFRGESKPTDVLSFPATPNGKAHLPANARMKSYLGDIAISPETARRNAKRLGRSLSAELRVLILHGALHLMGYDHEADSGEMDRVEARFRRKLGLS